MPNDKLSEAQAIYVSEIRKVQESADTWRDFLDFSAKVMVNKNQSEFEFSSKLIIHARNSKATDCRQFGEWKTNDGNHVNRHEKGIPVLSRDKSGKQSVTYLFDTSQTAFPKDPERVAIPDAHKDNFKSELNSVIDRLSDNVSFSDEQKRLFRETAEYKFCKQYQLDISENTERFSGIENLSVREIANIGIVLNRCGQELSAIIERNDLNEQEQSGNSKSREDRAELYGRERRGVDLGSGLSGTRNEVRVRRGTERVEQTQRGESDIRTADRDTRTETDSRDGQVRHSEIEVHMADTVSDRSDNAERGYNATLRGNERESLGADGEYHREEETVGRVQGGTSLGQISSDTPVVGEIQERSGGRDTSGNSLRNIKDEAAEPEKVSAVSDLSADIPDEQPKEHSDGFENSKRSKNGDIILGNTTFRYIPEKTYTKISKDIAAEVADQLEKQGVKFSGVIKGDTATITVSKPQKEALDSIIASVSSPDNDVTLSQSEFIEIASNILSEDNKIFNAHRNSDEQNYRLEVNSGIDRIWAEAISNSRDIGYSVSEMSQLWESFQNDSSIKEHIQAVVAENVDITLTEREQQIEKTRQFAKEQGLPFSENYSKGADEKFNPYVADSSMSPEDYEKMHELINADKSRPTVDDLSVGDVILYDGKRREVEQIDEKRISLKDLDAPDYGGILLGTSDVYAYDGWQEEMNEKGFEIISKAEPEITLNVGDVIKIAPDRENHELSERYGVVELSSEYRLEVGTYDLNDTAFCMKKGGISCDKNIFAKEYDFEYIGNVEELRNADHEQNKAIYEALENHDIIHLTIADETAETFIAQNVQNSKIRDLRIEYNEFDDEKNDYDKGFVLKGDTEKIKDCILVSYGEISPESMYLSIKNDKFNVSEIETNEPEKTFEHENKTTISTEIVDEEKNMSRQMSLFDDISDIEDFPDFIEEESIVSSIPEPSAITDFRAKTEENFKFYNFKPLEIENMVKDFVQKVFEENGVNADIHGAAVTGSRSRGLENADSDIDVVIEVDSDLKEDALFNIIHDEEFKLSGYTIDINPIKADETGTLETYLPRAEAYLTEKAQNNKHTDLDVAKQLITDYLDSEFGEPSDFSDISKISLAYTTDEEHDLPIQVYADLEQFRLIYEYDGNVVRNEQYNSLAEMNKNALSVLDFSDLVSLSDDEILSVIQAKSDEPLHSESEIKAPEKPQKFTITDYNLGEGGAKTKFKNNLLAIQTLKQIESEDRRATPEEQEIMSKYVGWGGLQEAFDEREASWRKEFNELKSLLTEEEYEAARSTVNDAFYTSPIITQAIYEGLSNIGFKGGEILEPSMGVGNFFGTMPDKMRENSNLAGIEIDSISGRIAQKLYPEADIAINGFEKIKLAKGSFDLAVGNVPFGNHGVNDKTKAYSGMLIHDYFFAKSLDSVRSGGVVAFITSTGTLDKEDIKVRQMLAQKAELMGAVRLPNNAFQKNAGTQTSTDIIFLKKREKPLNISDMPMDKSCDWVHTKENADGLKINSYFADNPDMVLGNLSDNGRFGSIVCTPIQGADLKEQLHNAMKHIKGEYVPLEFQQELDEKQTDLYLTATPDIENLTYTVVDDKLYYRVDDNLIPLKESEQHGVVAERRKAMCGMGKTVRELLQAQVEDRPDSEIKSLQAELTLKYDKFVKKFGRINPIETPNSKNASGISRKAQNSNAFKNDVRLPLLQSLEKLKDGQFIGKTEIFTERTIRPHKVAEHVETSHEALILSMSEKGRIDFDYMEQLTGFDRNKIVDDLHGDIFPVPELSTENNTVYQTSDEYLSGNIYKKIAQAEAKISENPEYADNIAALTEVIPKPLKATEIDMQLGMTWIDTKVIQQFMYELFETPTRFKEYDSNVAQENPNAITVNYSGSGKGSWKIKNARLDNSLKSTKNFGTKDYNAYELLEKILNAKSVAVTETVSDPVTGSKKTIILEKETKAAEDKVKQINAAFKKWIFADPERRNELVKTYNEKFNGIRPREYDGSYLNFFGSNPEITLKPHQKNAVAHALFGGNTLFAHQVGAGKTFEMIATAMEGKRLGLHNKSMFVVPNHLTEQIGSDFMKLYPNANILVAKADDFSPQKRRQMCARIATGNFDAVIIGHSQLIKIPLSSKREEEFIRNQINEVMAALDAANETDSKSYTVKQLEAIKAKLRDRLEKLTNGTVKDNAVTFEELGVDKLFVDEAHEFKNLYVSTKMENVSGLSTNADVQKTQDLYMKCQYLDEKTNSKGVVFSTGTPVTNALSEMYTTMKYLQSDLLKETGLNSFDAWAGNFTRKSTEAEISPSGSDWRMKTRLKFTNVPELVTMFKECADIKMADQLNLDVPDCEKHIVSVEPTIVQKAVVEDLAERAERINQGAVSRSEDNMLVVTGDGRKLGLDQRLFDINFADEPQTKLNSCVQNVFDIWEKTAEKKSTQLVFCDLGVPQSKEDLKKNGERFDVYNDIRSKLIEKGIPEKEIAFIHDAASEVEKAKLFSKVRNGDVRVLIGSTQKMGAGTNVQDKLIALHDLDCPWRPADLTQRLGRMVRQGNENKKVDNFRYVTKGTFDAYLYQMVEKKQESIAQIFTSKAIARTCDDIDDMAVDFMQVKMAAIGDERIRRQMELREDIRSLNMLKNTYLENKYEIEDNINKLPDKIANIEKIIKNISDDTKTINNFQPKKDIDGKEVFEMKIGDTVYTDKKEAAEAFDKTMKIAVMGNPKGMTEIAEYKGFKIDVSYDGFCKRYYGNLNGANSYPIEFGSSESGNITRIDNTIASVPKRIDKVCNELERLKVELADSKKEINQPFEYESELEEKKQELERLTDEINADKVNGEIPPEQPESTSHSIQAAASEEQPEQSEKPKTLNIKWRQNDKELRISYDSSAENKITSFSDGKEVGHCSVDELTVSRISENEQKNYPADINKCVKPLNLAFSSKMAMHIRTFAEKVKTAEKDTDRSNTALFSREKIMSDDFKPTSGKNSDSLSLPEH